MSGHMQFRPWQSSSSVALMSSSDYAIRVTLTPTRPSEGTRTLTLSRNKPCLVGRASKTKGELHQVSETNALFDCPVVSRQHAELRAHPWSPTGDQVTIIDYGSMHGTKVNHMRLEKGRCMTLRSGDVIQFGEKVTRGDDTHDAITVTFHRVLDDAPYATVQSQARSNSTFKVPDEEDSDGPDDDDIEVISLDGDEPHNASSAKTTPEQSKSQIGSQHSPIDLESVRPRVIDLTDKEDINPSRPVDNPSTRPTRPADDFWLEPFSPQPAEKADHTRIFDSHKIVEDSVDKDNSFYESYKPRTLGDLTKKPNPTATMASGNNPSIQQIGSSGVLWANDDDASSHYSSDSEMSEVPEAFEAEDEDNESNEEDRFDDDEDDMAHEDDEDDFDADSLYDPDSYDPRKEPSPELGSDTGIIDISSPVPEKLSSSTGFESSPKNVSPQLVSVSQPLSINRPAIETPYDPPRLGSSSFQHFSHGPWNSGSFFTDFTAPPPPPANFVRTPPLGYLPPPPPPPSAFPVPPPSATVSRPPYYGSYGHGPHHIPPRTQAPPPPRPSAFDLNAYQPPRAPYGGAPLQSAPFSYTFSPVAQQATNESRPESQGLNEGDKKKMSIGELIAGDREMSPGDWFSSVKDSSATGTKRKADEISTSNNKRVQNIDLTLGSEFADEPSGDAIEVPAAVDPDFENPAKISVVQKDSLNESSPRRRRISAEDDVSTAVAVDTAETKEAQAVRPAGSTAGAFAKMAGSAVLGGVATMAFLCSPLAEKALEYLA